MLCMQCLHDFVQDVVIAAATNLTISLRVLGTVSLLIIGCVMLVLICYCFSKLEMPLTMSFHCDFSIFIIEVTQLDCHMGHR